MTRFLHWRKMTWVVVAWSGGMVAWLVATLGTGTDAAVACATDASGAVVSAVTKGECLDAAGPGTTGAIALVGAMWVLGTVFLGAIWFMTRPLWRHGHGARLRRLRPEQLPWLYDTIEGAPPTSASGEIAR